MSRKATNSVPVILFEITSKAPDPDKKLDVRRDQLGYSLKEQFPVFPDAFDVPALFQAGVRTFLRPCAMALPPASLSSPAV